MAPGRYHVTCKSERKLQAAEAMAFTVRGLPVEFQPISSFKWVNVTRLLYGVPKQEVSKVLSVYGPMKLIKLEQYSNVYTGVRNVLMEVWRDIPARIRIAGHMCNVFYKGQKRLCFLCGKEGHFISKCPAKAPAIEQTGEPVVDQSAPVAVAPVALVPVAAALVPVAPVAFSSATLANVGVSRVKKLPSFYAELIQAWLDLRGKQDSGVWVIPRPSGDPLPISELTSSIDCPHSTT